jgi:hypothetical protein
VIGSAASPSGPGKRQSLNRRRLLIGLGLATGPAVWLGSQLKDNPRVLAATAVVVLVALALAIALDPKQARVVGGVLVIWLAAVVGIVELLDRTPSGAPPAPPASSTTVPACLALAQTPRQFEVQPDAGRVGLSFSAVTVEVTGRSQLYIRMAGVASGSVPTGTHLHVLQRPDPDSVDSTPEKHAGNGRYYLDLDEQLDVQGGCWATGRHKIGYDGARGLDFDYHLALLPDDRLPELHQIVAAPGFDGIEDKPLRRLGVRTLATFRVET